LGVGFRAVVGDVGEWTDCERAADAAGEIGLGPGRTTQGSTGRIPATR
jgi:hypothetical protein